MKHKPYPEWTDKNTAEIFDTICTGWLGSQMLFPAKRKDGEYINICINARDLLDAIGKVVDDAKNFKYVKTPIL